MAFAPPQHETLCFLMFLSQVCCEVISEAMPPARTSRRILTTLKQAPDQCAKDAGSPGTPQRYWCWLSTYSSDLWSWRGDYFNCSNWTTEMERQWLDQGANVRAPLTIRIQYTKSAEVLVRFSVEINTPRYWFDSLRIRLSFSRNCATTLPTSILYILPIWGAPNKMLYRVHHDHRPVRYTA